MAKTLILLLLALGEAQGQQTAPRAQQSSLELYSAEVKGNKVALQQLRIRAEQSNAEAQNNLGWMYAHGEGVPKDAIQAVNWYRKAAEQGNVDAQFGLGWM